TVQGPMITTGLLT
nr:immunoglobulin heavy chain junction region [Mus musculus]